VCSPFQRAALQSHVHGRLYSIAVVGRLRQNASAPHTARASCRPRTSRTLGCAAAR